MNIVLVAHDARKAELIEWFKFNVNKLISHDLFATGTTGKLIREVIYEYINEECQEIDFISTYGISIDEFCDQKIKCLYSGPLGGDQQIGAMIAQDEVDVLIFFCDNLVTQGHQQDVGALSRLASLYNIAFATNRTTADMIITSTLFDNDEYTRIKPDVLEKYKNRKLD